MKKMILAVAAALSLSAMSMTACAPTDTIPSTRGTAIDERAMTAAEAAYNVAGTAYLEAVEAGVLTGARKDQAQGYMANAYTVLLSARRAYELGDQPGFNSAVESLKFFTDQAKALIPNR